MDKSGLIALLVPERDRVNKRIKRHQDDMPDNELFAVEQRRDALNYALRLTDQLDTAA